jgi:tRNA (guanine26-N2/guanine27-N2)-dimethyltransferase
MASLCGVYPKACMRKYGGRPLRTEYCHELAVRLLVGCLAATAAKYDMGISVVFSHNTAHYIRIYATTKYGGKKADESIQNMGYILHCFNCFHRETAKEPSGKCSQCGSKMSVAGPLWLGKIFDKEFCELMEQEAKHRKLRLGEIIRKILALVKTEVEAPITYYVIDKLCSVLALPVPPIKKVVETLREEGFHASLTHFNPKGIRTNASVMDMKELLRKAVTTVTW